jgi:sialidase-1
LFYAQNLENQHTQLLVSSSSDDGVNWSQPRDLTKLFDGDPAQREFHLPGPGHGIQLKDGRLVVPVWHRHAINKKFTTPIEQRQYAVSALYSDDGGKTWQNGDYTDPAMAMNESRIAELPDGRLMVNARMAQDKVKTRALAFSSDGGKSWSAPAPARSIREFSAVDAGLIRCAHPQSPLKDALLFCRPDNLKSRRNMTVSASFDGGATWPRERVINAGPSFYSDIAELNDGSIGVLYGTGGADKWMPEKVMFFRFDPKWLDETPR